MSTSTFKNYQGRKVALGIDGKHLSVGDTFTYFLKCLFTWCVRLVGMALLRTELGVVLEPNRNVRHEASDLDDIDDLSNKKLDKNASLPTGGSATSEDYIEERYKVDRRKLEQMIQGKVMPVTDVQETSFLCKKLASKPPKFWGEMTNMRFSVICELNLAKF